MKALVKVKKKSKNNFIFQPLHHELCNYPRDYYMPFNIYVFL